MKRKIIVFLLCFVMAFGMIPATVVSAAAQVVSVSYQTHVQDIGWQGFVSDGAISGTSGQSKRLEGIELQVVGDSNLGITYSTHVQDIGWQGFVSDGVMSGTSGQSKRLEAIKIQLTGKDASLFDVYYCVHAQNVGWMDWAKNGISAGTAGYSYRLEAIKIVVLPKGAAAPGSTKNPFIQYIAPPTVSYKTHVQDIGWQSYVSNGEMSGTSAQSKRLEAIQIKLENMSGGIEYRTHVQDYGWMNWVSDDVLSGTSGQSKRLEAIQIRLTGAAAELYNIYYCVHAQNVGWMDWAKNGGSAGTAGFSYRLEAIKVVLVPKGSPAPGATARAFDDGTKAASGLRYTITDGVATITNFDAPTGFKGLLAIPNTLGGVRVTGIGDWAFYKCTSLTGITIPSSVTSIGDYAFCNCSGLTGITIPSSVTSIGESTFDDCSGLTSITIPNSVTSIGDWAFYNCSGLTDITIPGSVTSIGDCAFAHSSGLTSVIIPDTVTYMGGSVFGGCTGLTTVSIPRSLISVNSGSLIQLENLKNIDVRNSTAYLETKEKNANAISQLSNQDNNQYKDVGATGMTASQLAEIRTKANEITAGAVSEYDKVQKIHDWIADNIYYDFDGLNTGNYVCSAYGVYTSRKTVCQGYANLTTAMLRSIGIPTVTLYGLAIYASSVWWDSISDPNGSNHAWNAVYADGRWFFVDTTWDSSNRYENGTWIDGAIRQCYFDPYADKFALDHRCS